PDGKTLELQGQDKTKVETEASRGFRYGKTNFPEKHATSTSVDADGTVHFEYEDGTKEIQKPNQLQVDFPDKSGYTLAANGDRYVWRANGDQEFYVNGKLTSQRHKESDGSEIRKDSEGRIMTVIAPDGQKRRDVFYDENGEPKDIQGYLGSWSRKVDKQD